jgi:hypothetical protein
LRSWRGWSAGNGALAQFVRRWGLLAASCAVGFFSAEWTKDSGLEARLEPLVLGIAVFALWGAAIAWAVHKAEPARWRWVFLKGATSAVVTLSLLGIFHVLTPWLIRAPSPLWMAGGFVGFVGLLAFSQALVGRWFHKHEPAGTL